MKFYRKDFFVDCRTITLIPTIMITFNNLMYIRDNIDVRFHWLCFNARIMWMKEEER